MDTEEKAQRYDEAINVARSKIKNDKDHVLYEEDIADIFPELKESEDEEVEKAIYGMVYDSDDELWSSYDVSKSDVLAWLEKQGNNNQNWKPSKEEMDVLYGLAYITNQYDEHKESVITSLYQDLKREFFNGSSYENMFPTNTSAEDDVRRRSTIQVLEYARSLDTYNQYGKADIDKNIVWLEKKFNEHEPNMIQWKGNNLKEVINFTGKDKNFDKWFKSFEEYEKYVHEHNDIFKLFNKDGSHYEVPVGAWIIKTPDGRNVASKAVFNNKSAEWNEEDETGLNDALWAIKQARAIAKDENDMGNLWYAENWLKNLKDRI